MNGKDLLESMGYVDEKYIQQAAAPQRCRRPHWRSLAAAAACLAVAILGIRMLLPAPKKQDNFAMMQRSSAAQDQEAARSAVQETAVREDAIVSTEADNGIAPMSDDSPVLGATPEDASSGTAEMVVRVLRQEADALVCVVTDPGTGNYAQDCEIRIALPDVGTTLTDSTSGAQKQTSGPAAGTGAAAAAPAAVSAETTQAATAEETIQETEEASAANQAIYFRVTYLPEEGSLIHPLSMTALEDED